MVTTPAMVIVKKVPIAVIKTRNLGSMQMVPLMAENLEPEQIGDDAPDQGNGPVRRCIVSGELLGKEEMIRFVVGPGNEIVPDIQGRLPGRGIWLSAKRAMVDTACKKNLFAKAARLSVRLPDDLASQVDKLMSRRCLNLLGLARRAGEAVAGFEKATACLRRGEGAALLAANDGSTAGKNKVNALAPNLVRLEAFSGDELGAALGRSTAVHVVLTHGRLAKRLTAEIARLIDYRGEIDARSTI
jgi:predicted RNA-binding protein YlxR (DUF448 family)